MLANTFGWYSPRKNYNSPLMHFRVPLSPLWNARQGVCLTHTELEENLPKQNRLLHFFSKLESWHPSRRVVQSGRHHKSQQPRKKLSSAGLSCHHQLCLSSFIIIIGDNGKTEMALSSPTPTSVHSSTPGKARRGTHPTPVQA